MTSHTRRGDESTGKNYSPASQKGLNHKLIERYQTKGDIFARNQLITNNMGFVYHRARNFFSGGYSNPVLSDLVQEGVLGFITGIDKYDSSKGEFLTYVGYWIDYSIREFVRKDFDVYAPKGNGDKTKVNGLPIAIARKLAKLPHPSFDDNEEGLKFKEPSEEEGVRKSLHDSMLKEKILGTLDRREEEVIVLYYGLNGKPPMSLREVANYFRENGGGPIDFTYERKSEKNGLSHEALNKTRSKALVKIRRSFMISGLTLDDAIWS